MAWFDLVWNSLMAEALRRWGMVMADIQMSVTEEDCGGNPVSQDFATPSGVVFAHWGPGTREMWVKTDPEGEVVCVDDYDPAK